MGKSPPPVNQPGFWSFVESTLLRALGFLLICPLNTTEKEQSSDFYPPISFQLEKEQPAECTCH